MSLDCRSCRWRARTRLCRAAGAAQAYPMPVRVFVGLAPGAARIRARILTNNFVPWGSRSSSTPAERGGNVAGARRTRTPDGHTLIIVHRPRHQPASTATCGMTRSRICTGGLIVHAQYTCPGNAVPATTVKERSPSKRNSASLMRLPASQRESPLGRVVQDNGGIDMVHVPYKVALPRERAHRRKCRFRHEWGDPPHAKAPLRPRRKGGNERRSRRTFRRSPRQECPVSGNRLVRLAARPDAEPSSSCHVTRTARSRAAGTLRESGMDLQAHAAEFGEPQVRAGQVGARRKISGAGWNDASRRQRTGACHARRTHVIFQFRHRTRVADGR